MINIFPDFKNNAIFFIGNSETQAVNSKEAIKIK